MPPHPQLLSTYIAIIGLGDERRSMDIQSGTACSEAGGSEKTKSVICSYVKWWSHPGKTYTGFFHTSTYQGHGLQAPGTQASFQLL